MQAFIHKKTANNVYVVELKGEVDFASAKAFYAVCMNKLAKKNIVFNLKGLNFVGSDGLTEFMNTLKVLKKKSRLKFCQAGSEFLSVFKAENGIKNMSFYEDEESAKKSF